MLGVHFTSGLLEAADHAEDAEGGEPCQGEEQGGLYLPEQFIGGGYTYIPKFKGDKPVK